MDQYLVLFKCGFFAPIFRLWREFLRRLAYAFHGECLTARLTEVQKSHQGQSRSRIGEPGPAASRSEAPVPGRVEGEHGGLHGVAGRKRLTGAGYRGRGIPVWGADKPGGGILPLGAVSVVLLTAIPLAQIGGDQHLGGLVNMAHHQRHGGGALGLNQGRCHGQNQGDQQKQRLDLHGYLLGDRK